MPNHQNESLDVNGKTVDEAIDRGLAQLGVSRDQVDIEIINEGKRGIFGIGSEDATVRLTPKPQPKEEPVPVEPETPAQVIYSQPASEPVVPSEPDDHDESDPSPAKATEPEASAEDEAEEAAPEPDDEPALDPVIIAKEHLTNMLEMMGIEADIEVNTAPDLVEKGEEPPTVLDIVGKDLGILIGRRSETLQALQYMIRLMVSKEMASWQRVVVDVESYRSRRRRSLQKMANRMAERAAKNHERVVLEAMTAYERRIVHIALRDHPTVYTKSIGRDSNRKVTIIPK